MLTSLDSSRETALAMLLSSPLPVDDLAALDMLYECWPRQTTKSRDPQLLAVAKNLSSGFGLPDRVPMASSRAWRMVDPHVFADDLADQLALIIEFIANWQKISAEFLILEFGEIDLIEYLFESLDINRFATLLAAVMNFKVLSVRRAGLLRRIPPRVERQLVPLIEGGRPDLAVAELDKVRQFLETFIDPYGFAPIVEAAKSASARIGRDIEVLQKAADTATIDLDGQIE